jgi:hypothetical protein
MTEYTAAQLANCAKREVDKREWVYPGLVERGKLTPDKAQREIAMMQQIEREYRAKAQAEAAKGDLFGGTANAD